MIKFIGSIWCLEVYGGKTSKNVQNDQKLLDVEVVYCSVL